MLFPVGLCGCPQSEVAGTPEGYFGFAGFWTGGLAGMRWALSAAAWGKLVKACLRLAAVIG
eukprot:10659875-Prorocentrum_lima.AAC.1